MNPSREGYEQNMSKRDCITYKHSIYIHLEKKIVYIHTLSKIRKQKAKSSGMVGGNINIYKILKYIIIYIDTQLPDYNRVPKTETRTI